MSRYSKCLRKRAFVDIPTAQVAIRHICNDPTLPPCMLDIYLCKSCGRYHIGKLPARYGVSTPIPLIMSTAPFVRTSAVCIYNHHADLLWHIKTT